MSMNMNNYDFKIIIKELPWSMAIEVYVMMEGNTHNDFYFIDEHGQAMAKRVPVEEFSDEIKPFLKLPLPFANQLFKAIADHLSNKGIKVENENLLKGKLEATELHLGDMREMAKKLTDAVIAFKPLVNIPLHYIPDENITKV